MLADRLLDGLNQGQLAAVTAPAGRLVTVAGAGSGKTRVLTRRIAWRIATGDTDPNRVLALTFTRRAAAELRQRQRQLGLRDTVPAGTFHSFALTQLRQRWTERRTVPPTLISSKIRLLSQVCRPPAGVAMIDVVSEIEWARARLVEPEDYPAAAAAAGRKPPADAQFISEAMTTYQQEKRRKRVVDFDDLLALAIRDLQADPDYAEAVRWRHRHFYVDEFQDVNPLQYQLLNEWLGDRQDLFLVGDPRQAIYGWNGADPHLMHQLMNDGETTTVELRDNYRSTPQVLGLAHAALTDPTSGADDRVRRLGPLEGHKPNGPAPSLSGYENDRAEATGIANAVRLANASGFRYSQQAVLVRTNAQLALIEQELSALRIPTQVRSGSGPLSSPEVKSVLRSIARDGIDLVAQLEELDTVLEESDNRPEGQSVPSAVERHNNLAALSRLIHEYLTMDPVPNGPGFLAWVNTLRSGDVDRGDDAVDLVTFHGAKGLEWPIVYVAGLEDGFVPVVYAKTPEQLAEEQRLLYVALTRAEDQVNLSWAEQRTFGTKSVDRQPAPILERLAAEITKLGGTALAPDWRSHIARSRQAIDDRPVDIDLAKNGNSSAFEQTYEELVKWRARKALAGRVPPHVIVSDHAIRAVAEHQPTTIGQLAAVTNLRPTKLTRFGQELLDTVHS